MSHSSCRVLTITSFFLHMCATRAAVHPGGKSRNIFKCKMSLLHVLMCYHFRHGRRSLSMVRCLLAECRDTTEWPSYLWGTHHCRSDCRPAVQADIYRYIQIYTDIYRTPGSLYTSRSKYCVLISFLEYFI